MSKILRIILSLAVLAGGLSIAAPAGAAEISTPIIPGECVPGALPGGALSLICVPASGWNGDLIVFAHGYVAFNEPLGFYNLELPDGTPLPLLVQSLGYAFATTSYRRNGLAILEGVADVRELVAAFRSTVGEPGATYITGASEGGAVAALSAEQSADVFDAGLSLCGPIGDFRKQIDYWGDFRVLYDAFFPDVLPPDAMNIPPELIAGWGDVGQPGGFQQAVINALLADQAVGGLATMQLFNTSGAAVDPELLSTYGQTTLGLLWYNVFATNDGKAQLRGYPFDNRTRVYKGSFDDAALNAGVQRFTADTSALAHLNRYNTKGNPKIPLITMHTTGDEIVPFWHQALYRAKLRRGMSNNVIQIPINRYGHCNFTRLDVVAAFDMMVGATGRLMDVPAQYNIDAVRAEMDRATQDFALAK